MRAMIVGTALLGASALVHSQGLRYCEVVDGGKACRTQAGELLIEDRGVYVGADTGRLRMGVPRGAYSPAERRRVDAESREAVREQLARESGPPRGYGVFPSGAVCVDVGDGCVTPVGEHMPAVRGGYLTPQGFIPRVR